MSGLNLVLALIRGLQESVLLLMFGLPAYALWLQRHGPAGCRTGLDRRGFRVLLGSGGLVISLVGLWGLLATMTGSCALHTLAPLLRPLLTATPVGGAVLTRFGLLLGWLGLALWPGPLACKRGFGLLCLGGGALISLSWLGHGASDSGALGMLHQSADSLHLLAAGLWLASLCELLRLAARCHRDGSDWQPLAQVGQAFSALGICLVMVLALTGLINTSLLLGLQPTALWRTHYGRLLSLKLILFALMLLLAANHRYRLVPSLLSHDRAEAAYTDRRRLWLSLRIETALGGLILAIVAWLSGLDPSV